MLVATRLVDAISINLNQFHPYLHSNLPPNPNPNPRTLNQVTDCAVDADSSPAVLRLAALAAVRRLGKMAKDDLTLLHPVIINPIMKERLRNNFSFYLLSFHARPGFSIPCLVNRVASCLTSPLRHPGPVLFVHSRVFMMHVRNMQVMALEVVVPEPSLGAVLTDLTVARQASVKSVASRGAGLAQRHVIIADAPLSNLLGYATSLRSLTAGEGLFAMEYAHHAPLDVLPPEDVPKRRNNEGQNGAAATLEP